MISEEEPDYFKNLLGKNYSDKQIDAMREFGEILDDTLDMEYENSICTIQISDQQFEDLFNRIASWLRRYENTLVKHIEKHK